MKNLDRLAPVDLRILDALAHGMRHRLEPRMSTLLCGFPHESRPVVMRRLAALSEMRLVQVRLSSSYDPDVWFTDSGAAVLAAYAAELTGRTSRLSH